MQKDTTSQGRDSQDFYRHGKKKHATNATHFPTGIAIRQPSIKHPTNATLFPTGIAIQQPSTNVPFLNC